MEAKYDLNYVRARNALIPLAEDSTNKKVGPQTMQNIKEWNREYFKEMDRLAIEKGLIT